MADEPNISTAAPDAGGGQPTQPINPVSAAFDSLEADPAPGDAGKPAPAADLNSPKPDDKTGDPAAGFRGKSKDENFAELRKKADGYETRIKELEEQIKTNAKPADYDTLKQQHSDLSKIVEALKVEQSPMFKAKYDQPLSQAFEAIKKTLKAADTDSAELLAALAQPESRARNQRIADAISELDDFTKSKLTASIRQYEDLREARAAELSNPDETFQKLTAEQQEQRKRQQEQRKRQQEEFAAKSAATISGAVKQAEQMFDFFKKVDGQDAWNQQIDQVHATIKDFWGGQKSQQDVAQFVVTGAMFPLVLNAANKMSEENTRLNEELAQYRKATPKTIAGGKPAGGGGEPTGNPVIDAFDSL